MLSPRQVRAARGLLGWDANELALKAEVSAKTISNIEAGRTQAQAGSMERIAAALIAAGVEFTAGQGVRMRASGVEVFEGPDRFDAFYDFLYEKVKTQGGAICLSVTDETLLAKYRKDSAVHYKRMQDLRDRGVVTSFRILAGKSNFATNYSYNTYKWQRAATLAPTAFYTFADCLALISFAHTTPPYVVVIQSAPLVASYIEAFNAAWDAADEPPRSKPAKGTS